MKIWKPRVSVIIPCYNQAEYLPAALSSVLNQTFQDWECIIVNDGSNDSTKEVAFEWVQKDNRFRCLEKENGGLCNARNDGIKYSVGDYILPLDADDKIGIKYLEESTKVLDRQIDIGIVYCEAEFFGEKTGRYILQDFSEDKMLRMNLIFCSALFRKSDYLQTKGYNPNMIYGLEDWDLWLSLIETGKGVFKLPDVHFYYRIKKSDSMIKSLHQDMEKRKYSLKTLYINHYDFYIEKVGNPIELYSKLCGVLSSKEYKIGKSIMEFKRKFKSLFK